MKMRLVDTYCVNEAWQTARRVLCLEIDGVAPCNEALKEFENSYGESPFEDLLAVIATIGGTKKIRNKERVKRTRRRYIYQVKLKGLPPRFYFFLDRGNEDDAIFVHSYRKFDWEDRRVQDAVIHKADELRKEYLFQSRGIR